MIKANVRPASIERLSDHWERHADGQLIWKEAPRDDFKSAHDWIRWNERYRGKPIDETPGALRVALVENKARRKWQVQVILGARRHTLSAYDDQQRAQEGYSFARCLFCPDPANGARRIGIISDSPCRQKMQARWPIFAPSLGN
jgi:hypothetical protein